MKSLKSRTLMVLLLALSRGALATRVLSVTSNEEQITLTNEAAKRRWQLNEKVCLFQGGEEMACGFVGRLTETNIVIQVETRNHKVQAGLDVTLQREKRLPTSNSEESASSYETATSVPHRRKIDVTLGPVVGLHYFYPAVPSVQVAIARAFSLGVDFRWTQFAKLFHHWLLTR